jgi:pimeloyl-ACP methyl ester carboxylesterase
MRDLESDKSTNVRSLVPPPALRLGLAMTSAVSPRLAALAAERLFLTPPRRRNSRNDRDATRGGEPLVIAFGRERLRAWRFGEGPAVLLLHGWGGRAGQLASFIAPLVAAGCSVVAFDAPAHGGSTGTIASIPAFADALREVAGRVGARAAVGHSMGAAGLGWALGGGLQLDAAVLVSPPRSPAEFFHRFCDALGLSEEVRRGARARLEHRFGASLEDFDIPERVALTSTPLLVVHDRDDREVPWSDGAAIARAGQGAPLMRTEGLGHRRILRDPSVAASATAFLAKHLDRCGCGRLAERGASPLPTCAQCAMERDLYDRASRWDALGAA